MMGGVCLCMCCTALHVWYLFYLEIPMYDGWGLFMHVLYSSTCLVEDVENIIT